MSLCGSSQMRLFSHCLLKADGVSVHLGIEPTLIDESSALGVPSMQMQLPLSQYMIDFLLYFVPPHSFLKLTVSSFTHSPR